VRSKYDDVSNDGNGHGHEWHTQRHADRNEHRNRDDYGHRNDRQYRHRHDDESTAHHDSAHESAADSLSIETERRRPARREPRGSSRLFVPSLSGASLNCSTPCDQAHQYNYDRDHEKQVNQSAGDVKHAEAEDPQNEENYRNCPKHCRSPRSRMSSTLHP
jgi:hypothetical protein